MSQRLPDAVDQFVASRRSQGIAANTVRNERRTLDKLMAVIGPLQVKHITEEHIDTFMAERQAAGLVAGSMNIHLQSLRNFFAFCIRRGYIRRDPVGHRRQFRQTPRQRLRVPAQDFPRLLDAATHPRDRALIAVGLFLWLRESEAKSLRVGDVNLADSEVSVRVHKTKQLDDMPISLELDAELRRWLRYYATCLGQPLAPDMFLLPTKERPRAKDPATGRYVYKPGTYALHPFRQMTRTSDYVHVVLKACGYPTHDENGSPNMEGMHTLRRSGARARFDHLVESGYDGAIREVQAGLHHSSVTTTERYIGLDLDRARRAKNIKGRAMYGGMILPGSNVTPITEARSASDGGRA